MKWVAGIRKPECDFLTRPNATCDFDGGECICDECIRCLHEDEHGEPRSSLEQMWWERNCIICLGGDDDHTCCLTSKVKI